MKTRIMYIERKTGVPEAFIGRVTFSKSGSTLYYKDLALFSVGDGIEGNYYGYNKADFIEQQNVKLEDRKRLPYDVYWVSGPKRNGQDRLAGRVPVVKIDEDVRMEYWTLIRRMPSNCARKSY